MIYFNQFADKKSIAAINERLTELSVKNEALQKAVADLKTENNAARKTEAKLHTVMAHLKIENDAMRKTDAILRDADAQLRLADARLRDVDAQILKDTKRQVTIMNTINHLKVKQTQEVKDCSYHGSVFLSRYIFIFPFDLYFDNLLNHVEERRTPSGQSGAATS